MLISNRITFDKDAIAMLTADHKQVQKAFKDYERLKKRGSKRNKLEIVRQACTDVKIHAIIEEELFYPAVSRALKDKDLIDKARVEHSEANSLIVQLHSMQPGDELYEAKFTVLGENIARHIKEEEGVMFPRVRKTKLDLVALGDHMALRKAQLQSGMSLSARKISAQKRIESTSKVSAPELRDV